MPENPSVVVAGAKDAFRTERLQFIRMDKNDADTMAYFSSVHNDPETYALAMTMLLRPQSAKTIECTVDDYISQLLPVMICLPAAAANADAKPTIIGELVVSQENSGLSGNPAGMAQNRNVNMGFSMLPQYQNKGYGREAINWALDWCFAHAGMHTVSLEAASYNERAMHLYASMGFVNEGQRREVIYFHRKWYDSVLYSMTEDEWEALRSNGDST